MSHLPQKLITLILLIFLLQGQGTTRISVLDLDNRTTTVTPDQIKTITDRIEYLLVQTQLFNVISISQRDEILKEQRFQSASGCVDSQCAVLIGQLLGASIMVGGAVSEMGDVLVLSAQKFSVTSGEILAVAEYPTTKGLTDLYFTGVRQIVEQLTGVELQDEELPTSAGITDSSRVAYLNFTSGTIGANISIDADTTLYSVPLINLPLQAGFHQLTIFADGHETIIRQFEIGIGDTLYRNIDLPAKVGKFNLTTFPNGAEVWLDGSYKGDSPLQMSLIYGEHDLVVTKNNYQDYSVKFSVEKPTIDRIVNLQEKKIPVLFRTIPGSAQSKLYISEKYIGKISGSGKVVDLPSGEYDVKIVARGFEEVRDLIRVGENGKASFPYELIKKDDSYSNNESSGQSSVFKIGVGVSLGYPALLNYQINLQYHFLQLEYSKGFADEISGKIDLSQIVENPGSGIAGSQLRLGLGTSKATVNFLLGSTNMFSRSPDANGNSPNWDYKGLALRKQSSLLHYEIGWLWGDGDVYKQEYFYTSLGFGFSFSF